MDSITQATLGAAIGEALMGKQIGYKAAITGAVIATVPDLDVILYLFYDSLSMLSIHRGLSHSILANTLLSMLLLFVLKKFSWTKTVDGFTLWLFAFLTLISHILLDAFTSYGTQLYLPFSDTRVGLDSINVVDIAYTIPLMTGLIITLISRKKIGGFSYNAIGITISSVYLFSTLFIKDHIDKQFRSDLEKQNISNPAILTMPVGSASLNWYGVARSGDSIYMKKHQLFGQIEKNLNRFPVNENLLDNTDTFIADKMRWFAKGFYTVKEVDGKIRIYNLQVDMRGIIDSKGLKAPTAGYFEIVRDIEGQYTLTSGSHKASGG